MTVTVKNIVDFYKVYPEYVGQIRAMRESFSHIAVKLSQMRPRYNQFNWPDEWRNWRIKGLFGLRNLENYILQDILMKI